MSDRKVTSKRSSRINVRISPEAYERLKLIAERLAMPPTTVAAFALSDWLSTKELQQQMMIRATDRATDKFVRDLVESGDLSDSQMDLLDKLVSGKE